LANPANDARLMAQTLRSLGFDVIELIEADQWEMQLATFELSDRLIAAGNDAVGLRCDAFAFGTRNTPDDAYDC
jgi:uncharacterized caspase-like protein